MATARRRGALAVVTAVALVALSAGVAVAVSDALGIRAEPAEQMTPEPAQAPQRTSFTAPPALTSIQAPDTVRMQLALDELDTALADAENTEGEASLEVVIT